MSVPWFSRSWLTKGDVKLQIVRLQKFGPYDSRASAHALSRGCPGVFPHGGTLEIIMRSELAVIELLLGEANVDQSIK